MLRLDHSGYLCRVHGVEENVLDACLICAGLGSIDTVLVAELLSQTDDLAELVLERSHVVATIVSAGDNQSVVDGGDGDGLDGLAEEVGVWHSLVNAIC